MEAGGLTVRLRQAARTRHHGLRAGRLDRRLLSRVPSATGASVGEPDRHQLLEINFVVLRREKRRCSVEDAEEEAPGRFDSKSSWAASLFFLGACGGPLCVQRIPLPGRPCPPASALPFSTRFGLGFAHAIPLEGPRVDGGWPRRRSPVSEFFGWPVPEGLFV